MRLPMGNGAEKRQVARHIGGGASRATQVKLFTSAQGVASVRRWHVTPLDVMLSAIHEGLSAEPVPQPWQGIGEVMRPTGRFTAQQFEAAVAAAPYVHPKLAAIAYKEAPDKDRERRRNLLARIPFEKRREIAELLASLDRQESDDVGAVVESVAAETREEGTE